MGSERALWKTLQRRMKPYWEADRVENPANPGTPDVTYTIEATGRTGWMELKHAHTWPKKETTTLKLDHFTPQQRSFIRRHGSIGGSVYLFLQVESDYILLDWATALKIGALTKKDYLDTHINKGHWKGSVDPIALAFILS